MYIFLLPSEYLRNMGGEYCTIEFETQTLIHLMRDILLRLIVCVSDLASCRSFLLTQGNTQTISIFIYTHVFVLVGDKKTNVYLNNRIQKLLTSRTVKRNGKLGGT